MGCHLVLNSDDSTDSYIFDEDTNAMIKAVNELTPLVALDVSTVPVKEDWASRYAPVTSLVTEPE